MNASHALNRRQYERIYLDQIAIAKQGIYQEEVFLFNLSLKGICFSEPKDFELAQEHPAIITFMTPLKPRANIEMKVDICRVTDHQVGALWREIDIRSIKALVALLSHYSSKPVSLDDIQL